MRKRLVFYALTFYAYSFQSIVLAQDTLRISSSAWQGLSEAERGKIQERYVIETLPPDSFGLVIDNQGADRSTPGSAAGSNLGEAVASASYIDRAIDSGDYSAKNHLGMAILGGLLGSALDSKPQSQYQIRYAIRLVNGSVIYQDAFSKDPFRHPVGVCVILPSLTVLPEQHICSQTAETLRKAYLEDVKDPDTPVSKEIPTAVTEFTSKINAQAALDDKIVSCKVGALAPVSTSRAKCQVINGVVQ